MTARKPAVVLLSGGLDSATVLAIARSEGFDTYALSCSYGQRHRWELTCASRLARQLGAIQHKIIEVDLTEFGASALTDNIAVPEHDEVASDEIPVTYVPARNTVFLSLALAWAEAVGSNDIFIGANAVDYSGYPDCRPEYIAAYEAMANLATKAGVEGKHLRIHAPLIELTKAEIIQRGLSLGVDYARTSTCYRAGDDGIACSTCPACHYRLRGFQEAGAVDPVPYRVARQGS